MAVLAKCSPLSSCPGYLRSPATPPFGYKSSQTLARCCSARVPHFAQERITFHWWVKQCFCVLHQCLVYGSEDQALWADVGTGEGTQPTHTDWKRWDKRAAGVNQPSPKEKTENRKQTIWWAKQKHEGLARSHFQRVGKGYTLTRVRHRLVSSPCIAVCPLKGHAGRTHLDECPGALGGVESSHVPFPALGSRDEKSSGNLGDKRWWISPRPLWRARKFGWTFLCLRHFLLPPRSFETWCTASTATPASQ